MTAVNENITAETLPAIAWQQVRVITTELLAKLYGAAEHQIRQNFNNNADRFVEGTHFYRLEGDALRELKKHCVEIIYAVPKNARSLTLWTERGAARHAKMLNTEAAWEVFEKLEDCYFRVKEVLQRPFTKNPADKLTVEQADMLRDTMAAHCARLPKDQQGEFLRKGWSRSKSHFKVGYRDIPQEEFINALSLITRHAAEWEVVDAKPALDMPSGPGNMMDKKYYRLAVESLTNFVDSMGSGVQWPTAPELRQQIVDGYLADLMKGSRWMMSFDFEGKAQMVPIASGANVLTPGDMPGFVRDSLITSSEISGLLLACAERLAKRNIP